MKLFMGLMFLVNILFGSVDINTASKKELIVLDGIGTKKADAIIKYRTHDCFRTIKELTKVKGIGTKTIEKNSNNLTVSECK